MLQPVGVENAHAQRCLNDAVKQSPTCSRLRSSQGLNLKSGFHELVSTHGGRRRWHQIWDQMGSAGALFSLRSALEAWGGLPVLQAFCRRHKNIVSQRCSPPEQKVARLKAVRPEQRWNSVEVEQLVGGKRENRSSKLGPGRKPRFGPEPASGPGPEGENTNPQPAPEGVPEAFLIRNLVAFVSRSCVRYLC